jgi:hypothetical protein
MRIVDTLTKRKLVQIIQYGILRRRKLRLMKKLGLIMKLNLRKNLIQMIQIGILRINSLLERRSR